MLRKETVSKYTLELLIALMQDNEFKDFFLAGGTALSLQIGHRISIDLDMFSINPFDNNMLLEYLESAYSFQLDYQAKNTLKGQISNTKVDFITHNYPLISPLNLVENTRLANLEDIAAMKLNAIAGNGTRVKDFIDIAYLSPFLTLDQMLEAYSEKYKNRNPVMVLKSLDYHDDINFDEPIEMVKASYSWKKIKQRLSEMIINPHKLFDNIG